MPYLRMQASTYYKKDAFILFSYQLTPPTIVACGDNSIAAHMFVLVLVLTCRFKSAAVLTLLAPVNTVFVYPKSLR